LSAGHRIILSGLLAALLLATFLPPIGITAPAEIPSEPLPPDVKIETVIPSAKYLVAIDFTPDGRLLYTERISDFAGGTYRGFVRVVVNGQLRPEPVYAFPVLHEGERGLLGIAVDPDFAANQYVWVYFSRYSEQLDCGSNYKNRVVRFVLNDDNTLAGEPETMGCFPIDRYETIHNGGNLHFGPDGQLYITVGNNDARNDGADPAQNLGSPLGKLHRFNGAGPLSVPADNPFPGSSIYAYGLRNSFDFDFDPITGQIFATENGDACDDEVNRLLPGGNYGWRPNYPCDDGAPGGPEPQYNTIPPVSYWPASIAPTGITFYRGDLIPEWKNDLFMCAFKDGATALHHFKLNASRTAIVAHTIIAGTQCRTDVLTGPDGALYYSEGGGYYNGPIKRLIRRTSFAATSVTALPLNPSSGGSVDYTIDLRHNGALSTTFSLTVTLPAGPAWIIGAQAEQGSLTQLTYQLQWSGTVTNTTAWTATYRLQISTVPTTAYPLTHAVRLTAPGATTVSLTPTVMVNGALTFLPLIWRGY
jgi:glucose/arabinose dehydrogenase